MTGLSIQLVSKPGPRSTGTLRYTDQLYRGLLAAGVDVHLTFPEPFPPGARLRRTLKRAGLDAGAFFGSYPLRLKVRPSDLVHLTSQSIATLLLFQRIDQPVVVTVLDIIPYLTRGDPALNTFRHPLDALFYRLALLGLRRADAVIAISQWTKQTLVEMVGLPADKIHVVYPAVDEAVFRPQGVPASFLAKYGLDRKTPYVLYVGSDDPRKNLGTLINAFALVRQWTPCAKLIMIGPGQFRRARETLSSLIQRHGLGEAVLSFSDVSDEDLALFYNLAIVNVLPSLYEGYGFPIAEAMACGAAVVASNRAALPEIAEPASLVNDIMRPEVLASKLSAFVDRPEGLLDRRQDATSRPLNDGWTDMTRNLIAIYKQVQVSTH